MTDRNATYAQRYYESALDLFEHGQYDKAIEHIDKAVASQPKNADLLSTRGVFLHKMNDLAGAIESYRKAIEIQPKHTFSRFNLGLIFMKIGRVLEAIQEWEAVIRTNPQDVDAIFNIAVALAQIGRRLESIPFYEKVLQLKPTHVQAHQNLGIIFRDEHQFAKAKHHLQALRELDSTYSEVVATEIRRCEEQEFLNKIAATDQSGMVRDLLLSGTGKQASVIETALTAIIDGDYSKALALSEEALTAVPGDLQALIVKGQALGYLGQTNEAIALFMSMTAEHPDCTEAFFQLGTLFLGLDQLTDALEAFERVKRIDSDFPSIDANIHSLQERLGINAQPTKERP
ncbi:MAG TPA: tetratricopeptide repeat protein [Candidatus Ozemobacteraceae bacterium]|nr:tetratricopeptide repeat protein [Candidatus Ozemobacteraceae bacterium]